MQKITYRNFHNESVTLSRTFPYLLQDLSGIGDASSTLLSQRGFQQDGTTVLGSLLEPRMIRFRIVIKGANAADLMEKRAKILRVFHPKPGGGELIYDGDSGRFRILACVCDGPSEVAGRPFRSGFLQAFDIGLYCPKPAWESYARNALKMVGFIGGMVLPLTLPFKLAEQGSTVDIDYNGTLDAPLTVEFRGPAVMPKIGKAQTGEYIEVDVALEAGAKLYIDTTPGAINVYTLDGAGAHPAFNYIKPQSSYFQLTRGLNTLSFSAAAGDPEVYVYWREQYSGI